MEIAYSIQQRAPLQNMLKGSGFGLRKGTKCSMRQIDHRSMKSLSYSKHVHPSLNHLHQRPKGEGGGIRAFARTQPFPKSSFRWVCGEGVPLGHAQFPPPSLFSLSISNTAGRERRFCGILFPTPLSRDPRLFASGGHTHRPTALSGGAHSKAPPASTFEAIQEHGFFCWAPGALRECGHKPDVCISAPAKPTSPVSPRFPPSP